MKGIAVTIISIFSVVIPIQSREIAYTYNYDNLSEIFPQGDSGVNEFHVYKYADIDTIFDTEYKGTNIEGAFLVQGHSAAFAPEYQGYVVNITATFYCGSTHAEEGPYSLALAVDYDGGYQDSTWICQERGWHYNYTWIPPTEAKYQNFTLTIIASDVTINKAYGFDELRITASDTPPQLLQRDISISSNDR